MGQHADDQIEGTACSYCGQFFVDDKPHDEDEQPVLFTHGYPVVCWDCFDPKDQRYPKSLKPTI